MKNLLKTEEIALLLLAVILNHTTLPYAWWWYWVLFLAPDISMIGYVVNTRIGAILYNSAHHKGVAVICYIGGILAASTIWQFVGLLLLGHSAFDRVFGYGLKHSDNFKNTHLGWIGKGKE